jgi:TATA-binding protein-associated factor Taf7
VNVFGLLTPSTPDFRDFAAGSFSNAVDRNDDTAYERSSGQASEDGVDAAASNNGSDEKSDPDEQRENSTVSVQSQEYQRSNHDVDDDEDTDDDEKRLQTQYDVLLQQIRDAELAATLADSIGKRRSTRLAKRDVVKGRSHRPSISYVH